MVLIRALALFAILALALLPTAGRVWVPLVHAGDVPAAAADPGPDGHSGHGAHAGEAGEGRAPAPADPDAPHQGHGDCAYCPLLASIVLLGVVRLPPRVDMPATDWRRLSRPVTLRFIHPCGLGSRGPPAS